MRARAIEIEF